MKRWSLILLRLRQWIIFDLPWKATGPSPITEADREWARDKVAHPDTPYLGERNEKCVRYVCGHSLPLLLLVSLICSAYPLRAQTIQINAAFEPSSVPRSSGVLQYIVGVGDTRPYFQTTMRPIGIEGVTFSSSAGVLRTLACGDYRVPGFSGNKIVCLETFGQAGIATSEAATSGIFKGGGSLVFPTRYGVAWVLSGEAVTAPLTDGWQARVSLGLRFNFQ